MWLWVPHFSKRKSSPHIPKERKNMLKIKVDFKSFFQKGVPNIDDDFFIRLITGYQGSGKSYLAVKLAHEEENDNRIIKTNIKSYHDNKKDIIYFENISDILEDTEDNVTYIIDELSKKYTKESKQDLKFYSWLQQSRKHKRHVYLITQEYIQVPTWLRGIANMVYNTSKIPILPIYKTTLGVPILTEEYEWGLQELSIILYKRTKKISKLYDTFESINTL